MTMLSPDVLLPANAATSTWAFLGTRGSGKTYGAGVLVEELLGARVQVVVVDPVGVWWALRISSDGHSRGFDIPVFGGIHGDIPLEPTAGELVAHLVVEQRVSLVLDVSDFTDAQQRRFVEAFSRTFFQLKKRNKSPTHLVFEEAHEFFPQMVDAASAPMVGATKRLWKVGRNYGIGGSLISTRAAEINKNALNITDRIITGRMTAPEDVKRIKDWASSNGVNAEQVAALTSMPKGQLIVWRDRSEGGAVLTTFRKKITFDASRTPETGDGEVSVGLPAVDLGAIRIAMAATIEEAKTSDPKALREEIGRLRNELATAPGRHDMVGKLAKDAQDLAAGNRELAADRDRWLIECGKAEKALEELRKGLDGITVTEVRRLREMERHFELIVAAVDDYRANDLGRWARPAPALLPPVNGRPITNMRPMTKGEAEDSERPLRMSDVQPPGEGHVATKPRALAAAKTSTLTSREGWTAMEEDLYQKFKARLIEEAPGLLKVLVTAPEIEVSVKREIIEVDGKSLRGRLARLLAEGYLDVGRKNGEIVKELGRTGPSANFGSVSTEIRQLIALGFIHNTDGGRYIIAPGAKVNIKK